jgi:hypothetical protein
MFAKKMTSAINQGEGMRWRREKLVSRGEGMSIIELGEMYLGIPGPRRAAF